MIDLHRRTSARAAACALVAALVLSIGAFGAAPALAGSVEGGNAFNELAQKAQEEEATTTASKTSTTGSSSEAGTSNTLILVGIGAAAALILAIGFVIVRDARSVAPVGAEDMVEGRSAQDARARHRNRRAKAKAARQQRKKNR